MFFVVKITSIGDYEINSGHVFSWKSNPGIYQYYFIVILNCLHIAPDFAESAEMDNFKTADLVFGWFVGNVFVVFENPYLSDDWF